MSIIHFTTELSGGAGGFVLNLHKAMLNLGMPSLVLSRERSDINGTLLLRPVSRLYKVIRSRVMNMLYRAKLLNSDYYMFGIEKCPVTIDHIKKVLLNHKPELFIFYWISYFIDFETIKQIKEAYPDVPIIFNCMDESLITGGCHYSNGCNEFFNSCSNCPGTKISLLQQLVERNFLNKESLVKYIDPIVVYPSSNLSSMGMASTLLKEFKSKVIPLGAVSKLEQKLVLSQSKHKTKFKSGENGKLTLLVRSSRDSRKGCSLFISSIKILSRSYPDLCQRIKVISIGDSTLSKSEINNLIDYEDHGYVDRKALLHLYSISDALLVTSFEDSGPLMINECIALGTFVISTPVGISKDLITESNGIVMKGISDLDIVNSIVILFGYNENKDFLHLRENSKNDISESLTFEGYINKLLDTLELKFN